MYTRERLQSFHVSLYDQEGERLRFKAQLTFTNDSKLFIKEYVFENKERKYAYHWTDTSGNLICHWDNANHWPGISTSPHHKHTGNKENALNSRKEKFFLTEMNI
ncbi:toxin-antitoxin system TumE family protein [Desulfosarcina sp. BuS5]|uniref:toxin-antitoxin system TumE family protein n=1 Tax=Desulfosarcina sp. BuS5 TaxID=933262 RepID=UPI003FCEDEC7